MRKLMTFLVCLAVISSLVIFPTTASEAADSDFETASINVSFGKQELDHLKLTCSDNPVIQASKNASVIINTSSLKGAVSINDQSQGEFTDSTLEAAENSLIISSTYLPDYTDPEKDFQNQTAKVSMNNSSLRTNASLYIDNGEITDDDQKAYQDHVGGSVILVKSANAELKLEKCSIAADKEGTGYLLQTLISDSEETRNLVPDGEKYAGISIVMKEMNLEGKIAHEDYQRDLYLLLSAVAFTGSINEYDFTSWNQYWTDAEHPVFCIDEKYDTHHGAHVTLEENTIWTVTEKSLLSSLVIGEGCNVIGKILVDGIEQEVKAGTYEGNVLLLPLEKNNEEETTTLEETIPVPETEHTHNWVRLDGGSPATCTTDGNKDYICTICNATYREVIPATGHNWVRISGGSPPDCVTDGAKYYECQYCTAEYTEVMPALGHDMQLVYETDSSCTYQGQITYQCSREGCTYIETSYKPLKEHQLYYSYLKDPTCTEQGYDVYVCQNCPYEEYTNYTSSKGHDLGLVYETDSSCTYAGQITYACKRSGCTYSETTYKEMLEHSLIYWGHYNATCEAYERTEYVCKYCPYTETELGAPPTGHSFTICMPYYDAGLQTTHHIYRCSCGKLDYGSESLHDGSPCSYCGW